MNQIGMMLAIVVAAFLPGRAAEPTTREFIDSLRLSLANDFGNPNAHLELAKAIKEQGDALTAFCICENAKKLFDEDTFAASFDVVFRRHISDVLFHARKQVLQQAISLEPRNASLLKQMADLFSIHGEPADAAAILKRALCVTPDDFELVKALQLNLEAAGQTADANAMVNDWCIAHPHTAPAWEARINDEIAESSDLVTADLDRAIALFPSDGQLYLMRAQVEEDQKPAAAGADYLAAARLAPDSATVQNAAGEFFVKVRPNPDLALRFYLAAYFLDPGFIDWEGLDQRVREASAAASDESKRSLKTRLADPNPMIQTAAIGEVLKEGDPQNAEALLGLTTLDCPDVREASIECLITYPNWSATLHLDEMLKNADPWTRAAAVSLSAAIRHATAVRDLAPLLSDPAVLVRYTAAAALFDRADGGKSIVLRSMAHERDPWLRSVIAQATSK